MARHPILQAAGKLTPRDRVWAAIRALKQFTRKDLFFWCAKHAPKAPAARYVDATTIASIVRRLAAGTYLSVVATAPGRYAEKTYRLVRDVGAHAPRVNHHGREVTLGAAQAQLWNGMRRLKRFDLRDLRAAAATRVSMSTAKNYCTHLRKAGYLALDVPANSRRGILARYRFVRDTGPRAPMILRKTDVYDPNLGLVVWPAVRPPEENA